MNEVIEKQDEVPSGKEADIASRMEALLSQLADMTEQRNALQAEINQERISKQLVEAAKELSIPLHIIQHDLPRYIPDFVIGKDGKAVARLDERQDAKTVLKALQAERVHWNPTSCGAGLFDEPMVTSTSNRHPILHGRSSHADYDEWFNN